MSQNATTISATATVRVRGGMNSSESAATIARVLGEALSGALGGSDVSRAIKAAPVGDAK